MSGTTGERGKDEFGDLVRIISRNKGWLSTIYLSSPGGSGSVFDIAFLIRTLRLKTVVARKADNRIIYDPDFAPDRPPLSIAKPSNGFWMARYRRRLATAPAAMSGSL